ncbi:uL13 family ribosomal protein [Candidatus Vidania fulgoroideae]|uniref:UL13 family ribosomal protein n=1 Tax=Candidatus Vidania fulgoroideorum TaxID=881286 RepID=A0A974X9C2_9PROT|nr:uL13 family ribosomal protein [Candidatus Vidania fulgoroideae]
MKIDLKNKTLGRYISMVIPNISKKLGKVVIVNASKIDIKKIETKKNIIKHNGRPGGLSVKLFREEFKKNPNNIVLRCIKGMLRANSKRKIILKNIKFK